MRAGGKAAVLRAARAADLLPGARRDGEGAGEGWAGGGWAGRVRPDAVARLVGTSAPAAALGVPVPLAHHLTTWGEVAQELEADRSDVVVVRVDPAAAGDLLDAPDLLVRVLDARLDSLAGLVGTEAAAAAEAAELIALRPGLVAARGLAEAAAAAGYPEQHHGCPRPGALAVPSVDRDDPAGRARPAVTVRAEGEGFVLSVVLPPGAEPDLARSGDRLALAVGTDRRTLRLPSALARCRVRGAAVVGGGAGVDDRLDVTFEPDPEAWR